jgi:electron transport complex protein RnfE
MADTQPTAAERFINGILPENPTFRQILGTCPTLAVTNGVKAALTMAGAVAFVLVCSNLLVSLIRPLLKPHLRILIFTLAIAAFVTIADRLLAAYMYDMSKQLGPYIPLIIVNCIIIARCEICASKQGPLPAVGDALGQSLGFLLALTAMASVREILGAGTWLGFTVLSVKENGGWFDPWSIMLLPPGAFIVFGLLMGLVNWFSARAAKRELSA